MPGVIKMEYVSALSPPSGSNCKRGEALCGVIKIMAELGQAGLLRHFAKTVGNAKVWIPRARQSDAETSGREGVESRDPGADNKSIYTARLTRIEE